MTFTRVMKPDGTTEVEYIGKEHYGAGCWAGTFISLAGITAIIFALRYLLTLS